MLYSHQQGKLLILGCPRQSGRGDRLSNTLGAFLRAGTVLMERGRVENPRSSPILQMKRLRL